MSFTDLQAMTVIQLRKMARENSVVLHAGIDKAAIIETIARAMGIAVPSHQPSLLDLPELSSMESASAESAPVSASVSSEPAPVLKESAPAAEEVAPTREEKETGSAPVSRIPEEEKGASVSRVFEEEKGASVSRASEEEKGAPVSPASSEPRFQAAWHSPTSNPLASHASYASTGTTRPAWQNTTPSGRPLPEQRANPLRPHSFGPRFGPSSALRPESPIPEAPSRPEAAPLPERRPLHQVPSSFGPGSVTPPAASPLSAPAEESVSPFAESTASSPTLEELLATGDFEEGGGILELHPDGYGFLRSSNFTPSSRDIYVSMAQIRRFSLRTGDEIKGKIRPQREGDKYAALLYIDAVNGQTEEEALRRPHFEELTAVYPSRRMSLEAKEGPSLPDMRLIDLIAPLGFGQRGLLLCPPNTGKSELLQHYANTIAANYPEAKVLTLLIDPTPEDVTLFRSKVSCPVLASTFDQAPEAHLRLTEMVVERAMRLVEQKKDVVILADSLTRLAKIYSSAAVQQGRSVPGMVNPASLLRAKRMFGAARALEEGGSLTVIATMDIASGNKVDDSVVEEFKGTANMELLLDQSLVRAGVSPAVNLQRSYTKNSDLLLNDQQKEGLNLIRQVLGSNSSAVAIPQLLSMMEKASTNADLLLKIKDWFTLMGI